jgi:SAM-dependent methyltransferase
LPEPVDLITVNFDTLNHLVHHGDLRCALRRIRDALRPGGYLFFDFITPCAPLGGYRRYVRRRTAGRRIVTQHVRWEPHRRLFHIHVVHSGARRACLTVERHWERARSPVEIAQALYDAGLQLRGVHDPLTLRPATRCLPRLLVLAQRVS